MDWEQIHTQFLRELKAAKARGLTQKDIEEAGGLKKSYIAKLKRTKYRLGPAIEIVIRALVGMGISPANFFAELEGRPPHVRQAERRTVSPFGTMSPADTSATVNAIIETLQRGLDAQKKR